MINFNRETDWKSVPWGVCKYDPDPERLNNTPEETALIKLINFPRVGPGIARSNNCRGLLIAPGEARTGALCSWPFITGRVQARHGDISVLLQLQGQWPVTPGRNCPLIIVNDRQMFRPADWKSVPWGFCKFDPDTDPDRLKNLPREIALKYKLL